VVGEDLQSDGLGELLEVEAPSEPPEDLELSETGAFAAVAVELVLDDSFDDELLSDEDFDDSLGRLSFL
jgi:hypothetical protein